jgi:hypothetical protein
MFTQLRNYFSTARVTPQEFKAKFFKSKYHSWISENRVYTRIFTLLLDGLNDTQRKYFMTNEIIFTKHTGHLGSAIGMPEKKNMILIYPELDKILLSASYLRGVAILAHEMGHIYHQHSMKVMDPLEAQCEADEFAFDIGFGDELQEVLLDYGTSIEEKVRIARLTSLILTTKKEN